VIERRIRAFNPWPGAFTELKAESGPLTKVKVFGASIMSLEGRPGEILRSDPELVIATGKAALSLTEIQLEGRKRLPARDVIRGNQWMKTATISHHEPGTGGG
jgi:methionyl-tRNA formyltransferase